MKHKKSLIIIITTLLTLTSLTVFASEALTSFHLGVFYVDEGYEAGRATKKSGSSYARVQVTWSNWINLATNFLVAQPTSGTQMTENKIIDNFDSTLYPLPYKSEYKYTGPLTVALRVNSGQNQANYTVSGYWSPNP